MREKMKELNIHAAYELLKNKYPRVVLDYVILSANGCTGPEAHKNAVIKALEIIGRRYDCVYDISVEKMQAAPLDIDDLLKLPDDDYYTTKSKINRGYDIPDSIPYWYAFLEPPHGNPYVIKDFVEFNDVLFPNKQGIEVFRWKDGFSGYFDEGKEWWGTGLWSAYDKTTEIIVIIAASATD